MAVRIAGLLGVAVLGAALAIYFSGAFSTNASPTTTRVAAAPPTRFVPADLPKAVRPGDEIDLAGTDIACLVGSAGGAYLECAPTESTGGFRAGSFGAVIRDSAASVCRLANGRCGGAVSRGEPRPDTAVAVPLPRRRPNTFSAAPGSVIPIGGTSVICDVQLTAGSPVLQCGLARNVIGSKRSVEVVYAAASFGIEVRPAHVAIVRWKRDGTTTTVIARRQPKH